MFESIGVWSLFVVLRCGVSRLVNQWRPPVTIGLHDGRLTAWRSSNQANTMHARAPSAMVAKNRDQKNATGCQSQQIEVAWEIQEPTNRAVAIFRANRVGKAG